MKAKSFSWQPYDVVTLVAYLDFCLRNKIDFKNNIIERLKESRKSHTGQEFEFTILQVKNKLIDLSRHDTSSRGSKNYPGYQEILLRGSVCFPNCARKLRQEIDEAVERLQTSYVCLQSQSASQSAHRLGEQSLPKERSSRNAGSSDEQIHDIRPVPAILRANSNVTPVSAGQHLLDSGTLGGRTLTRDEPSHSEVATRLTTPSYSRKKVDIRRRYSPEREDDRPWKRARTLNSNNDESRRLDHPREAEVATLYGKISDLEKHIERLMVTLQHSNNAREDRELAGLDPQESQFRTYHQQLWHLHQLNQALESTAGFFKLAPSQNRSLESEKIDESMDQIQSELELILGNCDTTSVRLDTTIVNGSDLEALILSSMNLHQLPQDLEPRFKECISHFEIPVVVRTLALAALNDWVFNASFPPFMSEGFTSLLLKSMQEVAMDFSNWACLRNWETAAYSRFLEKPEFKDGLLPRRARLLADRLINAIANFLIPISLEEMGAADGPEALDSILGSLHFRFIDLFSVGLKFKAAAGVSDNRYEFIVDPLNIEQTPELASRSTSQTQEQSQTGSTSRSWFHASLRVYEADPANWLNPRSDAIIQTNNFVPRLSGKKGRCIYNKGITIENPETRIGNLALQTPRPSGTRVGTQQGLLPLMSSANKSNNSDIGSSNFSMMQHSVQGRMGRRIAAATNIAKGDRPEETRMESSSARRVSTEDRLDSENNNVSKRTSKKDLYQRQTNVVMAEPEKKRSHRLASHQRTYVATQHEGLHMCRDCGTKLSSNDCLVRHERNKSCRRCNICGRMCHDSRALEKHQKTDHPTNKRQTLSEDHSSGKRVNLDSPEASKSISCEKCGYEFNNMASLHTHTYRKACSKCFKCNEEFDSAAEIYEHMERIHGLLLNEGHWKRINLREHVEGQPVSTMSAVHDTSEGISSTSHKNLSGHERRPGETPILPPSTPDHAQAYASAEADMNLESTQNEETTQNTSSQGPMKNGSQCSTCNQGFRSLFSLERHQQTQRHRQRVRELKKKTFLHQERSMQAYAKNQMTKGGIQQGGTFKSRVEKPHPRASPETRREPTPPSRHVARIIDTVNENTVAVETANSQQGDEQQTENVDASISQHSNSTLVDSTTAETSHNATPAEQTQIVVALANFGKKFSAPERSFENLVVGAPY